jgi:hypothetical protein
MSENTRELEKTFHAFSLRLIDGITKKLSLSVYTRKLERNCTLMPLEHIDCINDELSVSIYFRELEKKNYTSMLLAITDKITNGLKFHGRYL